MCEICGRSNCTRSFHSLEAQQEFDEVADQVKDTMRESLKRQIDRLYVNYEEDKAYISLDEVINIIDNY